MLLRDSLHTAGFIDELNSQAMLQIQLLPTALSELFVSASVSGYLTLADRYGLMAALLEESLLDEERIAIDRLLHAVSRGRISVVDELSILRQVDAIPLSK